MQPFGFLRRVVLFLLCLLNVRMSQLLLLRFDQSFSNLSPESLQRCGSAVLNSWSRVEGRIQLLLSLSGCTFGLNRKRESQVDFIYMAQYYKSHICLKGLHKLCSVLRASIQIRETLPKRWKEAQEEHQRRIPPQMDRNRPTW